jgi:hypothetical protein
LNFPWIRVDQLISSSHHDRGPRLMGANRLERRTEESLIMSVEQLMTGFPPPEKSQVTLANWRTAPFNRWAFQHVREIVPSADIPNASEDVWTLPSATVDFSGFSFEYEGERFDFDIVHGGDTDARSRGDFVSYFPNMRVHYRSQWYVLHGPDPLMFAFGIHGQNLFVDLRNEIVIAKVSSQPVPLETTQIMLTLTGVEAIRRFLVQTR